MLKGQNAVFTLGIPKIEAEFRESAIGFHYVIVYGN
jgi:hypothetical protein